jgi:hypothetical protein
MHTPKIIEVKEVNDTFVAYKIQCCDDAVHTSWHSISVTLLDHDSQLEDAKKRVSDLHEAKIQWRAKYAAQIQK